MSQLTAAISRKYKVDNSDARVEQPVDAATSIFGGSLVGLDSSTHMARQLVAGDAFLGIADADAINVANPATYPNLSINGVLLGNAGAINVDCRVAGVLVVPLASVAGASGAADINTEVYASDGNTLTKTSTSNTKVGVIQSYNAFTGNLEIFFLAPVRQVP